MVLSKQHFLLIFIDSTTPFEKGRLGGIGIKIIAFNSVHLKFLVKPLAGELKSKYLYTNPLQPSFFKGESVLNSAVFYHNIPLLYAANLAI